MPGDDAQFDLSGKAALVAGGSSGINLEIATRLAASGSSVAILGRSEDKLNAALDHITSRVPGSRLSSHVADVREYEAVLAALTAASSVFGPIDVVVSGAAGNFIAPAEKLSPNAFRTVVEIDLIGTFHVFRAAWEFIRKPGASLIAISAPQSTMAMWGQAHVSAAKAGVDMLCRSLAFEWGEHGIRVNALVPGPIDETEGMDRLAAAPGVRRAIETSIPLRRYGAKSEVAAAATFLASDAARYVTGSTVYCDGGQVLSGGGVAHPTFLQALARE